MEISVSTKLLKDSYVYPLRGNQNIGPRLDYCFFWQPLPHLFIPSFPYLDCLNLLIWTPGRSWKLSEAYFLQSRNRSTERLLCPETPQHLAQCMVHMSLLPKSIRTTDSYMPILADLYMFMCEHVWWLLRHWLPTSCVDASAPIALGHLGEPQ